LPLEHLSGNVLLVEDGEANQVLIATFLRKAGARVTIAANGLIAVDAVLAELAHGPGFDVILMDMQMPELDGYGATRVLREKGYAGPILALTAHAMPAERARCMAAGCDDYLTKPVQRGLLLSTVARWLAHGRDGGASAAPSAAPCILALPGCACGPEIFSELAGDPEMVDLVRDFVEALPGRDAELREALASAALDRVETVAHQLKGAAGGYGFPCITEAAARLERSVRDGAPPRTVSEAAEALSALCARARAQPACAAC
jgi:CheY-like chemotaxis protein/HPt (histidine-containing phosphotransfer) domain-containing protein